MSESKAEIQIAITLDEQRLAESSEWQASEADMPGPQRADAFILSLWNRAAQDTLGIDLWTKQLPVPDMRMMVGQTLIRLGGVFARATKDDELGHKITQLGSEVLASRSQG